MGEIDGITCFPPQHCLMCREDVRGKKKQMDPDVKLWETVKDLGGCIFFFHFRLGFHIINNLENKEVQKGDKETEKKKPFKPDPLPRCLLSI